MKPLVKTGGGGQKKIRIAVDIDDVLADMTGGWCEWSNRWFDTSFKRQDITDDDWTALWPGLSDAERGRRIELVKSDPAFYPQLRVVPGALGALTELAPNFDLVVMSSRWTDIMPMTERWVTDNLPNIFSAVHTSKCFDEVLYRIGSSNKGRSCREIHVDYLIDDKLRHCLSAAEHGLRALWFAPPAAELLRAKQEKLFQHITPVADWQAVRAYFAGYSAGLGKRR